MRGGHTVRDEGMKLVRLEVSDTDTWPITVSPKSSHETEQVSWHLMTPGFEKR